MAKFCDVCGAPSGMYPLCRECNQLKEEGIVVKDENTGKWVMDDEYEDDFTLNCLICGNESNEYLFCRDCYHKYKNKTLLLKVSDGLKKIELLNDAYEGKFVCKDGHIVKSKSERDIDQYLFLNNIKHCYEYEIYIDGIELHPDFYLPDYDAYIEHWGYDESNKNYTKTKEQKLELYRKAGLTIICTYEKTDAMNIESALNRKLHTFKKGIINFEE